ncbi:hypothetical protein OAK75_00575 [Bacteriovoracales bacterium]|nr:hypothetical protein [Bacteriovoracales bacterium]
MKQKKYKIKDEKGGRIVIQANPFRCYSPEGDGLKVQELLPNNS